VPGGHNMSMLFPNATNPQLRIRVRIGEQPEIEVRMD
jgi:hypothetical protein